MWRAPIAADYERLCGWPADAHAASRWAGPTMHRHWPPADGRALQQALYRPGSGYGVLADTRDQAIAFGEYYRADTARLRLARLIVCPTRRGERLVDRLIEALCAAGCHRFGPRDVELGVYRDNPAAIRAYRRLGFAPIAGATPDESPTDDDIIDMVRHWSRH